MVWDIHTPAPVNIPFIARKTHIITRKIRNLELPSLLPRLSRERRALHRFWRDLLFTHDARARELRRTTILLRLVYRSIP